MEALGETYGLIAATQSTCSKNFTMNYSALRRAINTISLTATLTICVFGENSSAPQFHRFRKIASEWKSAPCS
ncbi:hypothetical protein [Oceaniovalibus sp. ACAM 378]|uniref:hypothetical protein n=1 Tax=Oceaniovalibus sp. ACAM 378 TaxID=2599923 RepID=UPI0011DB6439|nr:hypothetical protein [Oceaniovalibus sp. ACAM 378]TYB85783.1 hypothetical protein FQ320_18180 [Oceaniovalibus sp. ACAM 378]